MRLILALILPAIIVGISILLDSLDRRANKIREDTLREYLHREELEREEETMADFYAACGADVQYDSITTSSYTVDGSGYWYYKPDTVTIPYTTLTTSAITLDTTNLWTVPKEPTCKCAYCECTNDHIYGTCDYCGAPLSGGDSG